MSIRPRGLVVSPDLARGGVWIGWLRRAGYMSLGCVGPDITLDCPRMRGDRCSVRESVSIAIVDVDSDASAALCTRLPDDGSTVFVRGEGWRSEGRASIMDRIATAASGRAATLSSWLQSDPPSPLRETEHGQPGMAVDEKD